MILFSQSYRFLKSMTVKMNTMMTPADIINTIAGYPMLVRLPSLPMVVPKRVDWDAEVGKYNKMLTK